MNNKIFQDSLHTAEKIEAARRAKLTCMGW